jgi:L-iduronidase
MPRTQPMNITLHSKHTAGPLHHFWRATGFTPASLLLDADMQQTLEYLGSVPHRGVEHVRIHFLLELVRGAGFLTRKPDVDWTLLDRGLDVLVANRLKPFFELMGNPGGAFTDFEDPEQVWAWRHFVRLLAEHLIGRYGKAEVRTWFFETWNEPDVGWWKGTVPAFLNYYDACSAGLADADRQLKFGGPGTCITLSKTFKALMAHLDTGKDFFTGKRGVRCDFISVHEKGSIWHRENVSPNMANLCRRTVQVVTYLRKHHPRLAKLPLMNNECDPIIGWAETHTWHATAYYAASSAKAIGQHLRYVRDENKVDFTLLSNDNGFQGGWGQRTHTAYLGKREDLRLGVFDQVKKPIHNLFTMLSLLGDERLKVTGDGASLTDLGVIATRRGCDQIAVLLYHVNDRIHSCRNAPVDVTLDLPLANATLAHYRIVDGNTPFDHFDLAVASQPMQNLVLDAALLKQMRDNQELELVSCRPATGKVTVNVTDPSVHLLLFTRRSAAVPSTVKGLRTRRYFGGTRQAQVMLTWRGLPSRVLRTYEVFHSKTRNGRYRRINPPELLAAAYLHVADDVRGWYKVRAVDYWDRAGKLSAPIKV